MIELDKTKIYDLLELNKEELQQVLDFIRTEDRDWSEVTLESFSNGLENVGLTYGGNKWVWVFDKPTTNAKELFYTLENIQVDCRGLTEEQTKKMCDIYENKGYYLALHAKENEEEAYCLSYNNITQDGEYGFYKYYKEENNEYTITYEKFMELFAPQYEVTMIVEQPKEEICDNLKPLINAVEILNELKAYKEKSEEILTLDNIQVDCTNLTEEQIKEMCNVYESNGYKQWMNKDALKIEDNYTYLRIDWENEFCINGKSGTKTTITYEKFMELFGENEKLPPYEEVPLKWNYETLVGGNQVVIEHTKEFSLSKKQVLKYLLKKDIILTPKQYKKLWKGL